MTRASDVASAVELGAGFVGVIFAPSGRQLSASRAAEVLAPTRGSATRSVGVFGDASDDDILTIADAAGVSVLQLHGQPSLSQLTALAARFEGEVWAVVRVGEGDLRHRAAEAASVADGILLDTFSARALGGTGESFDWQAAAGVVQGVRGRAKVIVAGGLHAGNVRAAQRALDPDVVDVSSGIESAVGVKDVERMRAFLGAVRAATQR